MTIKLLAFDIDNTLAQINEPILDETVQALRDFENQGLTIAFVSGKPAIYIAGLVRQVGLKNPVIIGENGLSTYYGCGVPPKKIIENDTVTERDRELLFDVRKTLTDEYGERIWFQPNEVSVTIFPKDIGEIGTMKQTVEEIFRSEAVRDALVFYTHADSIDIAPKLVNKGAAVKALLQEEGWTAEEMIAVGDGENDVPTFSLAGHSVGVDFKGDFKVDKNARDIHEAIAHVRSIVT
ncbi:HAD family hydrolase [Salisediminibacterium selenitireducens]|uniref:HAD-superfamily hydrolase, subfamily IIB n=1 Tax=Bacillus selenitireducens (strain ATCC 700615 / DSM 15326 / MLS10) TaxID=439292 RepID=D6XZG9_BACIE|nr:HAD family hydrolase [Salisediminibacterium selenitireducens]ADH98343.1 HAD-superfamily hydrolase, subfamily IIB [[Bacillus] selenitireducens MLS10]